MTYSEKFRVAPGSTVRLNDFDPAYADEADSKKKAPAALAELNKRVNELQFKLYAEGKRSLLLCFQAPDAGGKDGVIRNVIGPINPQGCRVVSFKEPSSLERAHNYLWRIERETPRQGEIAVFNRSHYEDVLIVAVHNLVPEEVWSKRHSEINDFERRLAASGTRILKFFLNISKEEQLERFKDRLDDPSRHWKISEADYSERGHWDAYQAAYEDALTKCSTEEAPWFVIPSNRKWFRNLAVARIIVETLEAMDLQIPEPTVDIDEIRKKYHRALKDSVAENQ